MILKAPTLDVLDSPWGRLSGLCRLLSAAEQKTLDEAFVELSGLPLLLLMEQAGLGLARLVRTQLAARPGLVVLIAGPGQNGGDVWVAARVLAADGVDVAVLDLAADRSLPAEAEANRQAALHLGVRLTPEAGLLAAASVVVDGVYGSGFAARRGLPASLLPVFSALCEAAENGACVVACDLPSGVDATTAEVAPGTVPASFAVTFVRPKIGQIGHPGCLMNEQVEVEPLSFPAAEIARLLPTAGVYALTDRALLGLCPRLDPDTHKGRRGHALIVAGSRDMPGAPVLAGRAAGLAGYTTVLTADEVRADVVSALPSALLPRWEAGALAQAVEKASAVAYGPGLGPQPAARWLDHVLESERLLIDADGLNQLASRAGWQQELARRSQPVVLTPHVGEFRRLTGLKGPFDRLQRARELAVQTSAIVVLKGLATVIALPDGQALLATTGNAGLAKAGSGDVLTGLITGLWASGLDTLEAVAAGVHLHGLAADLVIGQKSRLALLPDDLIAALPLAFKRVGWEAAICQNAKA